MRSVCIFALVGSAGAFSPSSFGAARRVGLEAKKPEAAEPKKKSFGELYTDGEYGQAFKFPWQVPATDKTMIGHILPIVVTTAILVNARMSVIPGGTIWTPP
ncbi:hypothetical protein M885DRAFT_505463 [Pelagophyceae sp. CCMP2097]|nr:hypothetical protein M885DRAFT_505463 [Pelagophyceae sp. CCMP2097]